jgi:DNA-binding transcriptional regulator GbsR (MarR family)
MAGTNDARLRWLEDHWQDAVKGLDLVVGDMIKEVSPYAELLRYLSSPEASLYPEDMQKATGLPRSEISKGIDVLKKYRLVEEKSGRYSANDFGKHVLDVV